MTEKWSRGTKLGTATRYIISHFDKLTAYLDDPELEPSNNLRERMLRLEKLIQGSSMFRRSLEDRFVRWASSAIRLQAELAIDITGIRTSDAACWRMIGFLGHQISRVDAVVVTAGQRSACPGGFPFRI